MQILNEILDGIRGGKRTRDYRGIIFAVPKTSSKVLGQHGLLCMMMMVMMMKMMMGGRAIDATRAAFATTLIVHSPHLCKFLISVVLQLLRIKGRTFIPQIDCIYLLATQSICRMLEKKLCGIPLP
jgi:hypothetical protein